MKEIEEDLLKGYFEHCRQFEVEPPSGLNERIMERVEAASADDIFAWQGRKVAIWSCVGVVTLVLVGLGFYLYYIGAFQTVTFALPKVEIKSSPISNLWVMIGSACTVFMVFSLYLSRRLSKREQDF